MKKSDNTFHTDQVATIAGGHFTHDTYSAFLAPLLPLLKERLASNYAFTGGLAIFTQLPSLMNPFIGYLADRISLRYFIIFAPAITGTLMSCVGLTSNYVMLAMLLTAVGFSISTFHAPAPAMIARVSGDRVGKGMSMFMAAGEMGRTLGPIAVAAGVSWFGLEGLWRMAFVGWAVSGILYLRLRHVAARPQSKTAVSAATFWPKARRLFPIFTWLMITRILMLASLTTFLTLYINDVREGNLWLGAAALTILEGAGVVGALFAGTLSDKLGRVRVLLVLTTLSAIIMLTFLYAPNWAIVPLLIGLGLTAISPQPVLLAVVQDEFAENRALANGSYLAVNFTVRAMGIAIVGVLADKIGLQSSFIIGGVVMFTGIPAILMLGKEAKSVY